MHTWHPLVQLPNSEQFYHKAVIHFAALPAAPLQYLPDRVDQSLVVRDDNQHDATHASLFMGANELTREVCGSAVDDLETEQLLAGIGIDTLGCSALGESFGLGMIRIALRKRPWW